MLFCTDPANLPKGLLQLLHGAASQLMAGLPAGENASFVAVFVTIQGFPVVVK
jgi:hypothetical protein